MSATAVATTRQPAEAIRQQRKLGGKLPAVPGQKYLFSPSRNLIMPFHPTMVSQNLHNGDWCPLEVEEPSESAVSEIMNTRLRELYAKPGMDEAALKKAIAEAPKEATEKVYRMAWRKAVLPLIDVAKRRAQAAGPVKTDAKSVDQMQKESLQRVVDLNSDPLDDAE